MKKNLNECVDFVLLMECGPQGLIDGAPHTDPHDPGGFTIWGLSKRAHPWVKEKTTKEEAIDAYEKTYWRALKCDDMASGVDLACFDFAVNAGVPTVRRILKELKCTNDCTISGICERRRAFYTSLAEHKPEPYARFLKGWLKRVDQVEKKAQSMVEATNDTRTET